MAEAELDARLHLVRDGTIAGAVTGEDGERIEFHGWLELMDALERLRASAVAER